MSGNEQNIPDLIHPSPQLLTLINWCDILCKGGRFAMTELEMSLGNIKTAVDAQAKLLEAALALAEGSVDKHNSLLLEAKNIFDARIAELKKELEQME